MNIVPAFISHSQAPLLVEPCIGALHHPAVPTQPLLRLDARPCDPRSDAASAQALAVLARSVRLVGVQFAGPMPGATPRLLHLGHCLQQGEQLAGVVDVGSRQTLGQGPTLFVDEKMMLTARLRSARRFLARERPPFDARTLEDSIEVRLKSSWPRCPSSSSSTCCSCSPPPSRVHCSMRRHAVIPERPNCLTGSISQGMPVRGTKTMASKAARSLARGRPRPNSFFLGTGSRGATRSHSASGTSSRTMVPRCSWAARSSMERLPSNPILLGVLRRRTHCTPARRYDRVLASGRVASTS